MATANGRRAALLLAACFIGGIAGGHAIARLTGAAAPETSLGDVETPATNSRAAAATAASTETVAAAAKPSSAARTTPLPARDVPISSYYEELAQQARDGDAQAARRLADDLYECATQERQLDIAERLMDRGSRGGRRGRGGPRVPGAPGGAAGGSEAGEEISPEEIIDRRLQAAEHFVANAVQAQKRCEGVDPTALSRSAEWIRQAAAAGDPEAQLCYALAPNEWNREIMSPQWVDWSERWNSESPAFVRQAFESGLPEAAAVLSGMYSTWQPRDARPWTGRLGDDPYWAYAYAAVAQQTLSPDQATRWSEIQRSNAARLSAERIAQADAWAAAARARIRFQAPAVGPSPDNSLCGNVRRAGAR
ncbi:hypothetical protein [Tahibacter sp.]|uniref:hypothetical protein n=1 Tax=Tahibacter sp. TaxID=2056211 RepID=UPI0028C49610|nr:hypothetical protein [Tahibacter sp.]